MYYLCKRNEYGDTSIIISKENISDLIVLAIKAVTKDNMENSLSMDEKLKDFKSAFPLVFNGEGERIDNVVYAGLGNLGKHTFIYVDPDTSKLETVNSEDLKDVSVKFFLGTDNKKDYYLKDYVGKSKNKEQYEVSNFKSTRVERKTFYFLKKV